MTQSGLSDFSSAGDADGEADGDTDTEREELAAQEAAVVAGGGRGHVNDVVDVDEAKFPESTGTVELMITQIDYAVEGYGSDEYPVVHVFGRRPAEHVEDADHDVVEHLRVLGVEPYFYVPTADLDRDPVDEYDVVIGTREAGPDGEPYESIRGEPLTRIVTRTPRDVGNIRDDFATSFEADILFPNRFLIDNGINGGIRVEERRLDDGEETIQVHEGHLEPAEVDADLRVNTFDIEVDDRRGFPEDGEEPIICLTSHDSYEDEYVVWLYDAPEAEIPPPEDLPEYEGIVGDGAEVDFRVRTFDEEAAMLDAFVEYIDDTDPDLLTGWNFEDFDAPYVLDRLEVLDDGSEYDLDVDRLSRIGEVWRSGWGGPDVKGRVVFDLLYAYKRTMFTELESYRLDAVGERELGVGKERYTGDIGDLWEQDPERLLEYSIRDVELCVEIDRKQDVIAFWDEVRTFVGCKIEDAPTPGDTVDMYVLHKAFGKFALPTKGQQESEEFEGGAVFDPITGVKEMVTVQDLKSLYPMCMVTINAGPETKVDPDEYGGETYVAPNGTHFRKEPDGIMREMVDELLSEREEKKALRNDHDPGTEPYEQYDRQQGAVKVIMNSLYGVTGWDRFRLYDKEGAAAVTATGREVIDFTEEAAEELNYQVAYGDTDSVMLSLSDMSEREAIETSFEIEDHINERYDDFARDELNADEHRFEIEFEKLYRRFFQAGKKKRYAGHIVWKEGKEVDDIDITGFEYKRSDIAGITKEVQQNVIETIVTGDDIDEDMEEVKSYLEGVIARVLDGDVDLDEIGIPGGIGKQLDAYDTPTAQVRGAKYANRMLGTNFGSGSKPKRLYIEKVHPDFWTRMEEEEGLDPQRDPLYGEFKRDPDVICFEYADQVPEEFEVDWEKMLDKTLKGPIERVIEALGMSWEEVKTGQEQTGLGSFM
ncbi:DNA-directed DNA polymerase [Halorubrum ezzemoulense]|uniref:DNA polymerase n=1 Tax=Halorubrum ezzemoulense TaxID=337243 RepID=A0ABT4Z5G3_HALEZ|nr:DNA-directed DNA polymerase [Halorubrum ezzemoulense]MDB2245892.1 DNA-directed DNA polymerase [Halorubrum ezzemoulense]MDB2252842.1 DNA-directed DNA polymerase [Halorubrum ezzemoulense]MDB2279540.1 DNA-directed DNA polymerase [Halorubrum ezzemoulense]MDB2286864.1 DNA-directed DNA polymerase [Halorubrum ezzemoulense]MDB2289691.1 DNA-directed DNA polymerase [Halorubrum ezzemoulense]